MAKLKAMENHPLLTFFSYRSGNIPATSFAGYSFVTNQRCPVCRRCNLVGATFRDPVRCTVHRPRKWTDFLGDKTPIVSERVIDAISAECTGFKVHPVNIRVEGGGQAGDPPPYFAIEPLGEIDIDRNELDDEGGIVCPGCHRPTPTDERYRHQVKRIVPKMDTWDGSSDFLMVRNVSFTAPLCSWKVVELALKNDWTHSLFGERAPGAIGIHGTDKYDPAWRDKLREWMQERHPDLF